MLSLKKTTGLVLTASVLTLAACQGGKNTHVPAAYYENSIFDRHEIETKKTTEFVEIDLDIRDSQLRREEIRKAQIFFSAYNARGHGPLMMSIPENHANQQLVVAAAAELRDIGWQSGVDYEQMSGSAYAAETGSNTPIILAFTSYDAIAPECGTWGSEDLAKAVSNSDLASLGCAVRTNMAAMIADPADLKGERELEGSVSDRRTIQFDKWRQGEVTGAGRSDDESGAVSQAVN